MKQSTMVVVVGAAIVVWLLGPAMASSRAVIIQGWLPAEAMDLDWSPDARDRDELWNDCALWYQLVYNRPAIAHDTSRIHMLWAQGSDYWRTGVRYGPQYIDTTLDRLTDDSATVITVENCFGSLDSMGPDDTLFVYTWGHGGYDKGTARNSSHFSVGIRPIWFSTYWHSTPLWDSALARMADSVLSKRVFVMQQCHGGGFVDDLADDRTVLICAGATGERTHSCDNMPNDTFPSSWPENEIYPDIAWRHGEFNFHFMNALRGAAIWPEITCA